MRFVMVDFKKPTRHGIFYRAKITAIDSVEHTCMMSNISYKHACKTSTGHPKINLNAMNTAVTILKMNPNLPAQMLRPILKDSLPCSTNLDGKFIDNFRRRVAIHLAKNPNHIMVSMDECKSLSTGKDLSKYDYVGMNDPTVRANLNDMY